ncbi:MAG TPA: R2-like ligand-binding oxidase [Ktedonobacterales bacterium]
MSTTTPRVFTATSPQGLRQDAPAMRLWQKAKRLGTWNPSDIDFSQDVKDWQTLAPAQRETLLRQSGGFLAGEESVTLDLLPLIMVIAREGRIEEEMFLTAFLWEEAKHVDGFRRFLDEVAQDHSDLARFHGPAYRQIFYEELPASMNRLLTDASPQAQIRASVTYNMIVEGVLAETGYYTYARMLGQRNILPGLAQLIELVKRDESRHIAYAVYFISRLIAEHGDVAWRAFEERMGELAPVALQFYNNPAAGESPFGIQREEVEAYATTQFRKRYDRIAKARGKTLAEIERIANTLEDVQA